MMQLKIRNDRLLVRVACAFTLPADPQIEKYIELKLYKSKLTSSKVEYYGARLRLAHMHWFTAFWKPCGARVENDNDHVKEKEANHVRAKLVRDMILRAARNIRSRKTLAA